MAIYIGVLVLGSEVFLELGLVEELLIKYTVMLVMKAVKGLNYKVGLKLVMVMAGVGGDIVSGDGISIG